MSNETLDEAGVLAKFDVRAEPGARPPHAHRRRRRQRPRRGQGRPEDSARSGSRNMGRSTNVVAHAAEIPGVVGENLRAALDWLPQARKLLTVKTDCDVAGGAD